MADEPNAPATDAPEQEPTAAKPEQELGEGGKKALEAERQARREAEARVKDLEPLAARLQEIEDAKKDDATRAAEALAAAETALADAKSDAARLRAAVKHGLTDDDLNLLGSGTADEIEERAAALAARLSDAGQPRTPKPDPTQGRGTKPTQSTADQFAAAFNGLK